MSDKYGLDNIPIFRNKKLASEKWEQVKSGAQNLKDKAIIQGSKMADTTLRDVAGKTVNVAKQAVSSATDTATKVKVSAVKNAPGFSQSAKQAGSYLTNLGSQAKKVVKSGISSASDVAVKAQTSAVRKTQSFKQPQRSFKGPVDPKVGQFRTYGKQGMLDSQTTRDPSKTVSAGMAKNIKKRMSGGKGGGIRQKFAGLGSRIAGLKILE